MAVERWTQERRRQHTRDLLLDAAEDVFARRGFAGASLDEIADAAGYTRGAIYKHFGGKADLFLEVNARLNERVLASFLEIIDPATPLADLDLASIAKRWHETVAGDPRTYALEMEFILYVFRHPELRERVAQHRRRVAEMVAAFVDEQVARAGLSLRMPSLTLARIVVAISGPLERAAYLDGTDDDLFEPFLQLLVTAWEEPQAPLAKKAKPRKKR